MAERPDILCIGAMLWDVIGHSPARVAMGDDLPGRIVQTPGGVALNVARALAAHGMRPAILSALGRDDAGDALIAACQQLGVDTRYALRSDHLITDFYIAIEDPSGLIAAIADARALEAAGDLILAPLEDGRLGQANQPWAGQIVLDGNLPASAFSRISTLPVLAKAQLRVVPASPDKAARLRPLLARPGTAFYLNRTEAEALAQTGFPDAATAAQGLVALGAHRAIVTDSAQPVADAQSGQPLLELSPPKVTPRRITGAGDCFLAAHLAAEARQADRPTSLRRALEAAAAHISGKETLS